MKPWPTIYRETLQHHRNEVDRMNAHFAGTAEHERSLRWWAQREFDQGMEWDALVAYGLARP